MAEAMVSATPPSTNEETPVADNMTAQFDALKSTFTGLSPEQKMVFKGQVSDLMEFVTEME